MNRFTFLLTLVLFFSVSAFAQVPLSPARYTVVTLPAPGGAWKNKVVVVINGSAPGDCRVGGGIALTLCISTGSTWIPLGDGTGGGARRRAVKMDGSPPNGLFSPAIVAGELVFTSGQIGVDRKTGEIVAGGIEEQTEQVFRNLAAVLEAAGSSTEHILKATVFLADMADYNVMNELYRKHFKGDPPARTTVQVARLPRNARIEIEAVAIVKKN